MPSPMVDINPDERSFQSQDSSRAKTGHVAGIPVVHAFLKKMVVSQLHAFLVFEQSQPHPTPYPRAKRCRTSNKRFSPTILRPEPVYLLFFVIVRYIAAR